ncbi:MAG: hypothetical protein P8Y42_05960 [Exilibacterium sp.]
MQNDSKTAATPPPLERFEKHWVTDLGCWYPGEKVIFRGKDLFDDLKEFAWMELLLFGITRREPTATQVQLFSGIWAICTSFPDPRLWNNRIGALAGTARSTVALGLSAGIATSEAIVYGYRPLIAAMDFLCKTLSKIEQGEALDDILTIALNKTNPGRPGSGKNRQVARVPGFGRPLTSSDERIKPLMALAKKLQLHRGKHVSLAHNINHFFQSNGSPLRMNIASLMGALAADQGLSAREYYHYVTLCFSIGILLCAIDAQQKPEGAFFPLSCARIKYQGPSQRHW